MKTIWTALAAMALVATMAGRAQADTFTVDTLIGAIDSDNSGQAYEEAQLELACGCDVTLEPNVTTFTVLLDDAGNNYIDVAPDEPGYFILKFGTGNTGNDMFFFQNIAELTKLVWTDAQLTGAGLPADHVDSISHYAITDGGTTRVPDGGTTLSLLGLALAGIGAVRRYRA